MNKTAAPTQIFVAFQSGVALIDGKEYLFQRGQRLRADHPVVRKMGKAAFIEDGLELPSPLRDLPAPNNERTPTATDPGLRAYRNS